MDLTTGQNTLVTTTDRDESPSFAPNGRFLVYATEVNGRGVLGTASVDGRLSTRLTVWATSVNPAGDRFCPDEGRKPTTINHNTVARNTKCPFRGKSSLHPQPLPLF